MSDWRDAEMDADLAAERALPTAAPELREALYARVMDSVAAPTGSMATPAAGGAKLTLVVALLAGIGGWVAYEASRPEAPGTVPVVGPVTASDSGTLSRSATASTVEPVRPEPIAGPITEPSPAAEPAPTARPTPRRAAPTRRPTSTLAAEQALLEGARRALAADDAAGALAAIDRHDRRFATGQLAEERELLRVQALVRAGRHDAAEARAARFRARFPDSLLLEALNVALALPAEAEGRPSAARFEEN